MILYLFYAHSIVIYIKNTVLDIFKKKITSSERKKFNWYINNS